MVKAVSENPPPLKHGGSSGWNGRQSIGGGCDPKADSTRLLLGGLAQKTVLDTLREEGEDVELDKVRKAGYGKTLCVESGGPGRESAVPTRIITAINLMERSEGTKQMSADYVSTMSGDVVCGGLPCYAGRKAQEYIRLFRRNDGNVRREQYL